MTSYDYDAPLDEAGHPTEKYWAFREVIARYAEVPDEVPEPRQAAPERTVPLHPGPALLDVAAELGDATAHRERCRRSTSSATIAASCCSPPHSSAASRATLAIGDEVRDRAWILVDGRPVGVLARDAHERAIALPDARGELTIVVEDQGRVNYGTRIGEDKGLIGGVTLDGVELTGWTARPIDLDRVPGLAAAAVVAGGDRRVERAEAEPFPAGPFLAAGTVELDAPADLFLDTLHWGKGLVWVNGFLLGRYWRRGPQRTLFVPSPVTRAGRNEVVVLEFEAIAEPVIRLLPAAELGHTEI